MQMNDEMKEYLAYLWGYLKVILTTIGGIVGWIVAHIHPICGTVIMLFAVGAGYYHFTNNRAKKHGTDLDNELKELNLKREKEKH